MEFKIKRDDILKSFTILSTITGKATYLPILSHILMKMGEDGKLILKATDGEISIVMSIDVENVVSPGSCTVPAKEITDLFRSFDGDSEIHLKLEMENNRMKIRSGMGEYSLATLLEDAFPEIPEYQGDYIKLPARIIKEMISKTSASVRPTFMEFNLFGAKLFLEQEKIIMVSTDAYRLSYVEYKGDVNYGMVDVFIPKRAMMELQNFIGDSDILEFSFDEKHLYFRCNNGFMVSQKAEGGFPQYESIMPKKCENRCTLDVKKMKSALGRISIFTNKLSNHIFWKFEKGRVILSSDETEKGGGVEEVPIKDYSGKEEKEIRLNCSYLKEYFSSLKVEEVVACVPEGDKEPLLLVSHEGDILYKFVLVLL